MACLMAWNSRFSPRPMTTSVSDRSVVMPILYSVTPEDRVPRLSHDEPAQAIGPCTMWATSAIGNSAICAPSKEQPPAVAPGLGRAQPDFSFLLWLQAGSSSRAWISLAFMALSLNCREFSKKGAMVKLLNNGNIVRADDVVYPTIRRFGRLFRTSRQNATVGPKKQPKMKFAQAGCAAGRALGASRIGRLTSAASAASTMSAYHIQVKSPNRVIAMPPSQAPRKPPIWWESRVRPNSVAR